VRRLALLLPVLACGPGETPQHPDPELATNPTTQPTTRTRTATPTLTATPTDARPLLIATDAAAMVELEARGYSFGELVVGKKAATAAELSQHRRWQTLSAILERDIDAVMRSDRRSGVGMSHAHRVFDAAWLASENTRFELIGVVNRSDRRAFAPEHCGEVRLVYRLAYTTTSHGITVSSRLPMTVNVVFWQDDPNSPDNCAAVARRWRTRSPEKGKTLASWLVRDDGPLATASKLKAVEINLQSVRWPSTVHPSMAGHAEYLLRVFHRTGDAFVAAPLENQPDIDRIARSPALKTKLKHWIENNIAGIDAGTATLPEEFLAKTARSVAPRGMARRHNRPFRQLLSPRDVAGVNLSGTKYVRTNEELLRRLDGMSCSGCHESRSMAGFHLLGEKRDANKKVDVVALALSPHLGDEIELRRMADRQRPLPERTPGADKGDWGAHCGLTPEHFADWTCAVGLSCQHTLGEEHVGQCLDVSRVQIGAPCEVGTVTQTANPRRDRVGAIKKKTCSGGAVCERNAVGFPAGMCAGACSTDAPEATCGGIALLTDFNDCLARGLPFGRCITTNSRPAGLRRCDADHRCRDDYVCADTGRGSSACMPPYFLFQLRVDGHPL
jgi:hypothetical protein